MREAGTVTPSAEDFAALARDHRVIPVTMTLLADGLTPVGIYRRLAADAPGTFLMESAAQGGVWSRYSFIGAGSAATLTTRREGAGAATAHWMGTPPAGVPTEGDPVEVLRATLDFLATDVPAGAGADRPNLLSGMAGFLGWPTVRRWERLPSPPPDDLGLPELALNLITDLAVHDTVDGTVTLVANAINRDGRAEGAQRAWADAVERLESMARRLSAPTHDPVSMAPAGWLDVPAEELSAAVRDSWTEEGFLDAVAKAQQAITDGEVFQIVVSRRFSAATDAEGLDVYRVLRAMNPSPYMYLFTFERPDGGRYQVVGSSPEALVTVNDGSVVTHPIAGSRPRGATVAEDHLHEKDLVNDQKERAEHLMLVDLSRNDLSRVCVPGSVAVTQFMEVERFSHIMHLVSHVEGRLDAGRTALDVLAAAFPAGTLSGAPKPRALQLLDAWEPQERGPYGGVVGYFDLAGNMDMAINIRSALLVDGTAYVQAGAGIVADSVPAAEAAETVAKSSAPMRAVLAAGRLRALQLEPGAGS
ncbi:anthranilate synthase component I [Citricoccus sp. SGAir0253]|uniref:anthranilate synthase component I n=1 Tax=Citricoccus sp. SGAir0253 TaxID=2567881 RepID=UPI0010CD043B|nr:anthranilate synthase component I [Citricoccus sp. SGAir0253]QCU78150.1 anthranilate synthase component I [Citricoccus sp. SGAir0253]